MATVVLAVVGALAVTVGSDSGSDVAADETLPSATANRPTTTTSTTVTTTTTTTTTTAPPTTTVPPTTAPPAPPPPPPPPPAPAVAPATKGPISVLVAGDSLGFTAAFPLANRAERPGYITRIDVAAVPACGLLSSASWTPVDVENDRPDSFGMCSTQAIREIGGLRKHPNWFVMFSGGWEHLPWIPPGGTTPLTARSPEMRAAILIELVRRANGATGVGTRTAFVAWVCPAGVTPTRAGDYVNWYNDILREAARIVPGAIVVEPTDRVCVGGDAAGLPTPEKNAAFGGAYHPQDKRWLWQDWIGPILLANS